MAGSVSGCGDEAAEERPGAEGQGERARGATETVAAGERAESARYRMVFTLGQPAQNQGKSASPRYRLWGGLAAANGSLP